MREQQMKNKRMYLMIGGLLALFVLIRLGEYWAGYYLGNKDGIVENPTLSLGLSILYRVIFSSFSVDKSSCDHDHVFH